MARSLPWSVAVVLWRQLAWRHWLGAPWQSALLVGILALGVGTFTAIRLANRAALESFGGFTQALGSPSDFIVRSSSAELDPARLPALREALGDLPVWLIPVLETSAAATEASLEQQPLQLLGLDLIALDNLGEMEDSRILQVPEGRHFWEYLGRTDRVWVAPHLARVAELKVGSSWKLLVQDRLVSVEVAGILPARRGEVDIPKWLVLMDLPGLMALTGSETLDRVEVLIHDGAEERWRSEVATRLVSAASDWGLVEQPEDQRAAGAQMTAAFRLNLTILSLIALLVAVYLVAQGADAAVVHRRTEIGVLRSLGMTARQIHRLWLVELGFLGVLGSALGLLLGWAMAQGAVRAVARTVNSLYASTSVDAAALDLREAALGFGLGVLAALVAGLLPARDAAATPPAQVLARGEYTPGLRLLRHWRLGLLMVLLGWALALLPPVRLPGGNPFPLAGYGSALLWLVGGSFLAAHLIQPLTALFRPFGATRPALSLALARLRRPNSRHRLSLAGLFVATGMATSMVFLIGSFAHTVRTWMDVRFQADVYINSAGQLGAGSGNLLRAETWQALAALPEVAAADPYHLVPIEIDGRRTFLAGSNRPLIDREVRLLWVKPRPEMRPMRDINARAIISESFAARFEVDVEEVVEVETPVGRKRLYIEGIQADYGQEQGTLLINRRHLAEWFSTEEVTNLSLFLRPGVDVNAFIAELRAAYPALAIRNQRELRAVALEIFHETFSVTYALQYLALGVALAGLGLGMMTLQRENRRQLETLRRLGFSRYHLARVAAWEGFFLSFTGWLTGLLLGLALGWLLIEVINRQSFGWTLQYAFDLRNLALLAGLILSSGTLVSYLAGRWGAALPSDTAP